MTQIKMIEDASETLPDGETYWKLVADGRDQMTGWMSPELGRHIMMNIEICRVISLFKEVVFYVVEAMKGGVK